MGAKRKRAVANTGLADAIARTGWTLDATAQAINRVGDEVGLLLRYDASAVSHWLTGACPRGEVVAVAMEAFSRTLPGITAEDLGWPPPPQPAPGDPWRGDPVAHLATLGRDDMLNRRSALRAGLYSVAAAAVPPVVDPPPPPARPHRIAPWQVTRIEEVTRHLSRLDDQYGGGTRAPVAAYLVHDVEPLLRTAAGPHRAALFSAASRLAYLAGWMAYDNAEHPVSQRYYVQAARLAAEAGDDVQRAGVLRAMALQAVELGHAAQGCGLADAAGDALRRGGPPRTRAWVTGLRSQAYAAIGDTRTALALLGQAEREVERADSTSGWTGTFAAAALAHQIGLVMAELDDLSVAERHLTASVAARGDGERRSRTLIALRLADVQMRQDNVEEAAASVVRLRGDLPEVSSGRVSQQAASLRRAWQRYRTVPVVAEADKVITGSSA
ncbi:hypothetical protein [Streptosporangium canum]|uniref:hypothetical protein n=1 Tax=Streptosporangium canum TaxID=324952 RepID=UPI0033A38C6B